MIEKRSTNDREVQRDLIQLRVHAEACHSAKKCLFLGLIAFPLARSRLSLRFPGYIYIMDTLLLVIAAAAFSFGGLLMKFSAGFSRPAPTAGFLGLFVIGAVLQSAGMRRTDLSVAYIFVLGLEAALTVLLSIWYLRESCPPQRLAAILLVVAGIIWLKST